MLVIYTSLSRTVFAIRPRLRSKLWILYLTRYSFSLSGDVSWKIPLAGPVTWTVVHRSKTGWPWGWVFRRNTLTVPLYHYPYFLSYVLQILQVSYSLRTWFEPSLDFSVSRLSLLRSTFSLLLLMSTQPSFLSLLLSLSLSYVFIRAHTFVLLPPPPPVSPFLILVNYLHTSSDSGVVLVRCFPVILTELRWSVLRNDFISRGGIYQRMTSFVCFFLWISFNLTQTQGTWICSVFSCVKGYKGTPARSKFDVSNPFLVCTSQKE